MKMNRKCLEKTLAQLEKEIGDEIFPDDLSPLVGREKELTRKPLKDFTTDNLRFMIQQRYGWKFLIPLAIEILADNPFTSGGYYEGDLLKAVVSVDESFWKDNQKLWFEVEEIIFEAELILQTFQQTVMPEVERFRKNKPEDL